MAFLVSSGVPERDAQMAMLAASRFTVGCVLEEQADSGAPDGEDLPDDFPVIPHEEAFEAGLALILEGLDQRSAAPGRTSGAPSPT
ncbi:hypothetical protein [Streptomyces sp. NPDC005345]